VEAPRDRARVTRVELVDAARRVFLRSGFHGASLDEISAEAGYTTGAVCSRFGGKDELFLAVLDEAGAVAAPVRVTPVAALERAGRRREVEVDRRPVVAPTERRRPAVGSRPVVAGSDASIVLGALPVGLQLWESAGRDPAGLALGWSNRDGDREVGEAAARAALAGEAVDSLEPCADGVCRVRARPLGDGRVVVSFEDVTELAASERLSAAIVASLQQALIVVDTAGRITRSNEAAAALCGVSLGALVGSQLRDLPIRVSDREGRPLDPTRSPIHRALAGETVHRMLVHVARADGSERWVEVASCPLTEPTGGPTAR
jgi:PAS domain S-box-containing protein